MRKYVYIRESECRLIPSRKCTCRNQDDAIIYFHILIVPSKPLEMTSLCGWVTIITSEIVSTWPVGGWSDPFLGGASSAGWGLGLGDMVSIITSVPSMTLDLYGKKDVV